MATTYEFVVEELDFYEGCGDDPDIIDCTEFDTLAEATAYAAQCNEPWRIAVRRDTGNDAEGLTDRFYAYLMPPEDCPSVSRAETAFRMARTFRSGSAR